MLPCVFSNSTRAASHFEPLRTRSCFPSKRGVFSIRCSLSLFAFAFYLRLSLSLFAFAFRFRFSLSLFAFAFRLRFSPSLFAFRFSLFAFRFRFSPSLFAFAFRFRLPLSLLLLLLLSFSLLFSLSLSLSLSLFAFAFRLSAFRFCHVLSFVRAPTTACFASLPALLAGSPAARPASACLPTHPLPVCYPFAFAPAILKPSLRPLGRRHCPCVTPLCLFLWCSNLFT